MLDEDSRYIFFHRLVLTPSVKEAAPTGLDELLSYMRARFNDKASFKLMELETQAIRLIGFEHHKATVEALVLLLQLADTKIADPALANIATGAIRTIAKEPNEGAAVSAHVVIGLVPDIAGSAAGTSIQYPMLIEEVPRLTRTVVSSLLRQEIRKASRDAGLEFEVAPKQKRKVRIQSEVEGVTADLFGHELSDAAVRGVELVAYEKVGDGYEGEFDLKERKRSLILRPTEPATGSKIKAFINFAKDEAKKGKYSSLRLRYARSDGKERTASLDVLTATGSDHLANALTRCELLSGFTKPLEQCAPQIRQDFAGKMLKLLAK
jgi:hypothetical protein